MAEATVIAHRHEGAVNERLADKADKPLCRGKRIVRLDRTQPTAVAEAMALVSEADALIEGQRPGVMERLGLGPGDCDGTEPSPFHDSPFYDVCTGAMMASSRSVRWSRSSVCRCCTSAG